MRILNFILGASIIILFIFFINIYIKEWFHKKINKQPFTNLSDNISIKSSNYLHNIKKNVQKDFILNNEVPLNKYFIDIKYHKDYSHVLSALNNLVPRVKTYFNVANIPMIIGTPSASDIKDLLDNFTILLNNTIDEQVTTFRQSNTGWDEQLPEPKYTSGWEKTQKTLGLIPSLYNEDFPKVHIKIIDIQNLKKYETDDEIKYVMDLIIQGSNIEDQMSFKIGFTIDLRDLKNENNFNKLIPNIQDIKIEDLYINGFYSNNQHLINSFGENNMSEEYQKYDILNNFNDFDNFSPKNNLTEPKYIQKVLLDKYNLRSKEMNQRNSLLDEEGKDYHNSLPKLYDYQNIYSTQTIFDDMNYKKYFSTNSL